MYQIFQNQIISNKDFLLQSGYMKNAAQNCPTPFIGSFNYVFNNGSSTYCDDASVWDVCSNPTQMVVKYTLCSTTQFYSSKSLIQLQYLLNLLVLMKNTQTWIFNLHFRRRCCILHLFNVCRKYLLRHSDQCWQYCGFYYHISIHLLCR